MNLKKTIDLLKPRGEITHILMWVILVAIGVYIFYKRYPFNFTVPNFYAEDGKDYIVNIYNNGFLESIFTFFNGYLIVGQYLVGYVAIIINNILGSGFATLPKAIAISSYATLSVACTLPWLLFRKRLGNIVSLMAVVILFFTPFAGWDYAIIGTIGNLKFVFMYIAVMFVVFRNDKKLCPEKSLAIYLTDIVLMICVFTNILTIAVVPFALLRYTDFLKGRSIKNIAKNAPISLKVLLAMLGTIAIYILIIQIKGIPKIEGYLDGPMSKLGLVNSIFRSSWFGILYPVYHQLNYIIVFGLLAVMPLSLVVKKHRPVMLVLLVGIFGSAVGFVANRPGVTELTRGFVGDGGPAQFFYAGTMIFIFGLMYMLSGYVSKLSKLGKYIFVYFFVIYIVFAAPYSNNSRASQSEAFGIPNIYASIVEACKTDKEVADIGIYPTKEWVLTIKKDIACRTQ